MRRIPVAAALVAALAGCNPQVRDVTYINNLNCDDADIIRGLDRNRQFGGEADVDVLTQEGDAAAQVLRTLNYAVTIRCRKDGLEPLDDGTEEGTPEQ